VEIQVVRGRGVNALPENAPRLWSDALRQWTKSVVVSSLKLEADRSQYKKVSEPGTESCAVLMKGSGPSEK
jgi:hypothetical protein